VTVLERHGAVGHGSTSASCGIVRRFYAQPGMVAIAHEAAAIWAAWREHLGPIDDDLAELRRPGMLFIPPRLDEATRAVVATMRALGIEVELLDPGELQERFPFLDPAALSPPRPVDDPGFFEPSGRRIEGAVFEHGAGYVVSPTLATQNLASAAARAGARFVCGCRVVGIEAAGSRRFRLRSEDGRSFEADVLVNAAGPWSSALGRIAGVSLPLATRALQREVHLMRLPAAVAGADPAMPVIGDLDGGVYCRPEASGRELVVGTTDPACDELEWCDDADELRTTVTERYRQRQSLRLMRRMPALGLGPLRGVAHLYDVTLPDWYPICDKTDEPGYYVCIGTSGSSFKTAPVLGRLVAELVMRNEGGGDTDRDGLTLALARTGGSVDARFLSRLRGRIESSATVIG
jgi:glycine/D-amino acid oxidase-like deaminating enzyme